MPESHIVRKGETLAQIAKRYGTTVADLVRLNGISNPNRITVGQRIRLSGGSSPAPSPAPAPAPAPKADVERALERWARAYGLPTDLVKGLAHIESGWRSDAVSSAGAVGVMQLMPATADWIGKTLTSERIDRLNVDQNVRGGTAYLRWLLSQTGGDERLALASYYQGLSAVRRNGVYKQSEAYVAKVQAARKRYR